MPALEGPSSRDPFTSTMTAPLHRNGTSVPVVDAAYERTLCVFCGSSAGARLQYGQAAQQLASHLVQNGVTLIYGGAGIGLMGKMADAMLALGGSVVGVIPHSLVDLEVAHTGLTDLRVVDSMHERKAVMFDLADAFVALPGGLGTLEEFFEIATWLQLGLHTKPAGLLNVAGYFSPLVALLDHAVQEQFLDQAHRDLLLVAEDPADLLASLWSFHPSELKLDQWISKATH